MSVGNMNVAYPTIWTKVNTNWSAVNLQTVHFEPVTMEAYQQAQNAQGEERGRGRKTRNWATRSFVCSHIRLLHLTRFARLLTPELVGI